MKRLRSATSVEGASTERPLLELGKHAWNRRIQVTTPLSVTTADWLLLSLAAGLALGWTFFNARHRRDPGYRERIHQSVERFSDFTRRKLLRLLAPESLVDRWNHATVIAGCCCIILTPLLIAGVLFGAWVWWKALLLAIAGTLVGAWTGEAVFNRGLPRERR